MKKILLFGVAALIAASAAAQQPVYEIDYSETDWNFYVMGYAPTVVDGVLTSENPGNGEGGAAWYQYFIADGINTVEGESYTAVINCQASETSTMNLNFGWGWGDGQQIGEQITIPTTWTDVKVKYENVGGTQSNLILQPGTCMAKIEIKSVKVYLGDAPASGEEPETEWVSIITNGNANEGISTNLISRTAGNGDVDAPVVANPVGEGFVFESPIAADPEQPWDSQFFITFNEELEAGAKVKVSFDYYCTDERTIDTQAHGAPGEYHHWACIGSLSAGPEWKNLKKTVTVGNEWAPFKSIAFNLASKPEAATFYINNVVVELEKEIPSAVDGISTVAAPSCVYNLNGVKVADDLTGLPKGIYIVNGKKVVR